MRESNLGEGMTWENPTDSEYCPKGRVPSSTYNAGASIPPGMICAPAVELRPVLESDPDLYPARFARVRIGCFSRLA